MLRGNTSVSQYTRGNVFVWMTMAFQAGLINIGGYLACHYFVSHVTGSISMFFGMGLHENLSLAYPYLLAPLCFLIGAMVSGVLIDQRLRQGKKPKYYFEFVLLFSMLAFILVAGLSGDFGTFGEPLKNARDYVLLILLCLICGIQNGTLTTVSRSVIRTTHLTGLITDLGVGLVRVFGKKKEDHDHEVRANFMRLGIIFFFIFGCILGGFVFRRLGFLGFSLPLTTCGILLVLMLYFQVFRPRVDQKA